MSSKPKQNKKLATPSSSASVKTTEKIYDILENDHYRYVILMILLTAATIISTIMMVLIIVPIASFRFLLSN